MKQYSFIFFLLITTHINGQNIDCMLPASMQGEYFGQVHPANSIEKFADELFSPDGLFGFILHSSLHFTKDGSEVYFTIQDTISFRKTIMSICRIAGKWSLPNIVHFSGINSDEIGWISPYEERIYFFSHDIKTKNEGLFVAHRFRNESAVAIEKIDDLKWNDGSIFISATLPQSIGGEDIYFVENIERIYQMPVSVGNQINTASDEYFQCYSSSHEFIVFYRYDSARENRGLYLSQKIYDGSWNKPVNLSAILNLSEGFRATLSPSEEYLFILNRKDGIYWIDTESLLRMTSVSF
jgi:hypothetical protein